MEGWRDVPAVAVDAINADQTEGDPTVDVAIHYPSNLDPGHAEKVTLDLLVSGFEQAKPIFSEAGVQLRLVAVRSGWLDPAFFEIASTEPESSPGPRFVDMYRAAERRPARLSAEAESAFSSIVEATEEAERTVHLVALQDVFMTFFEQVDSRSWQRRTISTGGLSFPGYMHGSTMPRHLRGVISITDLTKDENSWKTIAHELGHKLLNVSHEYRDVAPQHEVRADGGLMLYGKGTEIPAGRDGRFHRERMHRSPYVYRIVDGEREWNPDYQGDGFYNDPIYDGVCVDLAVDLAAERPDATHA